jgi:hypothetical protein
LEALISVKKAIPIANKLLSKYNNRIEKIGLNFIFKNERIYPAEY